MNGKLSVSNAKQPFISYIKNLAMEKLLMWLSKRYKR